MERDMKGRFLKGHGGRHILVNEVELLERYNKGQSMLQISKEMKIGLNTVRRRLNKNGVTERRTGLSYADVSKGWFKTKREDTSIKPKYVRPKKIAEHRKVMEAHLGRKLKKGEVVHHIDCDPTNNSIENLMLFENQAEHMKHHISNV